MNRLIYLIPVPILLGSCKALESMGNTPADPANPTGPSQLDSLVSGAAETATSFGPVGWIVAAAIGSGYAAYKGTRKPTGTV